MSLNLIVNVKNPVVFDHFWYKLTFQLNNWHLDGLFLISWSKNDQNRSKKINFYQKKDWNRSLIIEIWSYSMDFNQNLIEIAIVDSISLLESKSDRNQRSKSARLKFESLMIQFLTPNPISLIQWPKLSTNHVSKNAMTART